MDAPPTVPPLPGTDAPTHAATPLLQVKNLRTHFFTDAGVVKSVEDVSFTLDTGETLAVVGESGSGKSVTSLSIMGLIPDPPGRIVGGEILFRARAGSIVDLVKLPRRAMRGLRGRDIAMIFQEPMTSLDPVFSIGDQIAEAAALHLQLGRRAAMRRALEMLELVEIPAAKQRIREYPHQLSGGMRQRVMIALALACNPSLLIADEPTTALDVTIQAQILALLDKLRREIGMAVLFITHNLGVVAEIADRVVVMYSGRVVEEAGVHELFKRPRHPYTRGLLACLPRRALDDALLSTRRRLNAIPGQVASPLDPLPGCAFVPRCSLAMPACSAAMPALAPLTDMRRSRCLRWSEL
jgi:oligopeptide/dipeptide ABC transporter ATP-binding protein